MSLTSDVRSEPFRRQRITEAAIARGKRLSAEMIARGRAFNCQIAYDLHVTESSLSRWRSGGAMSVANAVALAKHLGTSIDWLVMGRDHRDDRATARFSPRLAEITNLFAALSIGDRQLVLALNRALLENQKSAAGALALDSVASGRP